MSEIILTLKELIKPTTSTSIHVRIIIHISIGLHTHELQNKLLTIQ
jgi:hypothetical protein